MRRMNRRDFLGGLCSLPFFGFHFFNAKQGVQLEAKKAPLQDAVVHPTMSDLRNKGGDWEVHCYGRGGNLLGVVPAKGIGDKCGGEWFEATYPSDTHTITWKPTPPKGVA